MIDITNAGDLKAAYLQCFDSFSLTPGDIVESSEGRVNMRYARELLGTLVNARLVAVDTVNDDEEVWQVVDPGTYDDHTHEEAEAVIDAWLAGTRVTEVDSKQKPESKSSSGGSRLKVKNESGKCRCGCGEDTKSNYRPGHDARHAGQVGREIAANYATKGFDRRTLLDALPSDKLRAKAERIAELAIEKSEKKGKDVVPTAVIEHGIVKVGKTEHVATRNLTTGEVEYFVGDETKQASKTAAKTFQVG
jgi:hypothetical protein